MKHTDHSRVEDLPSHWELKVRDWVLRWFIIGTRLFIWCVTILSAMLLFYKSVTTDPGVNTNTASKIENLVYGDAWKPLVNRLLIPVSARMLIYPIPKDLREDLSNNLIEIPLVRDAFKLPHWNDKFVLEYIVVLLLMLLCLIGFLLAIRWLFVTVYVAHPLIADLVPLMSLFLLRPLMWPTTYPYDYATLFMSTLLIIFLIRGSWVCFAIAFLLASLNKETAIVFVPIFAYYFRFVLPIRRPLYNLLIVWQIGCWSSVKFVTSIIYGNNGGENFWAIKNWSAHNPEVFMSSFSLGEFTAFLVLFVACTFRWHRKPLFLRQLFLGFMWMLIPLHICIAWIDEIRSFYDVLPATILLIAHSLSHWIGVPLRLRENFVQQSSGRVVRPVIA